MSSLRIPQHALATLVIVATMATATLTACQSDTPPIAQAVTERDSLPIMTTYGVSKLISDSGVIRYKVVAEEWRVYDRTRPERHVFDKGVFLEKYDAKFHVEMYVTADTAYWYDQRLWELHGRVCVWNADSTIFNSELLYWDMYRHEFYSNRFSRLRSPQRNVSGMSFRSNEQMTVYEVNTTTADFPLPAQAANEEPAPVDTAQTTDSVIPEPRIERAPLEAHPARNAAAKRDDQTPKQHFR